MLLVALMLMNTTGEVDSTCYGSTSRGRLEQGQRLPFAGLNFTSYSHLGFAAGRTFVHSKVKRTMLMSLATVHQEQPTKIFVLGETGKQQGGKFPPHLTHQNGLSVDVMVPVVNSKGLSTALPCSIFNKFGYGMEFDQQGRHKNLRIDFAAMASHLKALHQAAVANGIGIRRVIFDPRLQKHLWKTKDGTYLKRNLRFSKRQAWVRHDEHYHIDFLVRCKPL